MKLSNTAKTIVYTALAALLIAALLTISPNLLQALTLLLSDNATCPRCI